MISSAYKLTCMVFSIASTLCLKEKPSLQPEPAMLIKNPAGLSFPSVPWVPVPCLGSMGLNLPLHSPASLKNPRYYNGLPIWAERNLGDISILPLDFFLFQRRKVPPSTENVKHTHTHTGVSGLGHEHPQLLATRSFWPKHTGVLPWGLSYSRPQFILLGSNTLNKLQNSWELFKNPAPCVQWETSAIVDRTFRRVIMYSYF